jgi:hypothetical protein
MEWIVVVFKEDSWRENVDFRGEIGSGSLVTWFASLR